MNGFNEGVEAAQKLILREADAYASEFGTVDPDTGTLEFGHGATAQFREEKYNDMIELAERIGCLKQA